MDVALARENKDIERLQQIAQQQMISGPLIGLTGLSSTILGTVAFYGYRNDRVAASHLLFPARIASISGQGFAMLYTPYTIISGMARSARLKKRHELPQQLLEDRLRNLDALEQQIRSRQ
jgi:hypothetical protein